MVSGLLTALIKTVSGSVGSLLAYAVAFKFVAITLGPAGTGLLSMLRQFQQMAVVAATMSGQVALVQGAASRTGVARTEYLRTVLICFLIGFSVLLTGGLLFDARLAMGLLGRSDTAAVSTVRWMLLPIGLQVLSAFCAAILNASGRVGLCALVQLSGAIAFAVAAYPLSCLTGQELGVNFAILLGISSAFSLLCGLVLLKWSVLLQPLYATAGRLWSQSAAADFLKLAGAITCCAVVSAGLLVTLRSYLAKKHGWESVGYFDAAWTMSMGHVLLLLSSLQTFYLPKLTQEKCKRARRQLILQVFSMLTALGTVTVTVAILCKPWLVEVMYSNQYLPTVEILRWTLIGDYLKISAWVLAMPMLANADSRAFMAGELLWNVVFGISVVAGLWAGQTIEIIGMAFLGSYFSYLIVSWLYAYHRCGLVIPIVHGLAWLTGLAVVCGASLTVWNSRTLTHSLAWLWLVPAFAPAMILSSGKMFAMVQAVHQKRLSLAFGSVVNRPVVSEASHV